MGTDIVKTQEFLLRSQHWNKIDLEQYRTKKLQDIILHAYNNVPFYRELLDKQGISPQDINDIKDIKKLPILTKEIVRNNQENLISKGFNAKIIKKGKTGGTTGSPIITLKDTAERTFTWASYFRWYSWMGIKREDKIVTLWGTAKIKNESSLSKLRTLLKNLIQNNLTINAFNLNERTLPIVYKKIIKHDPVLIKGYLSAILQLANYIKDNDLNINNSLKAVATTAETLLPQHRTFIKETFKVDIFDQYGCGEVSGLAYECNKHEGLHINEEHVIIEIIDDSGNDLVNSSGRIIVTSLDNKVMPFIRYEIGDLGTVSSEPCSCGINSRLLKSIEGRTVDTVTLNDGSRVNGVYFSNLFHDLGINAKIISRFQIEQNGSNAINIKLESIDHLPENKLIEIKGQIERLVKINSIEVLKKISNETNGKFRYIKRINE